MNRTFTIVLALATLLASACGDDGGGSTADSGPALDSGPEVDSGPDIDADTRPTNGPCSIVVAPLDMPSGGTGAPAIDLSGNVVVFSNPDGTLIESTTTNSKGEASSESCVRDTIITAVVGMPILAAGGVEPPSPEWYEVATFAGVQVNDVVYWGDNTLPGLPQSLYSNVNVTFDTDDSVFPDGIDSVTVSIRSDEAAEHQGKPMDCSTASSVAALDDMATLQVNYGCTQADGTVDVLARAYRSGDVVGYAFANDVAVVAGTGPGPSERGTTAVALGPWTAGNVNNSLSVVNPPVTAGQSHGTVFQRIDAVSHASRSIYMDGLVDSATFDGVPEGYANGTEAHAVSEFDGTLTGGLEPVAVASPFVDVRRWTEKIVSGPYIDSAVVDLADALPRIAGLVITGSGPTRPTVHWLTDGPATTADGAIMGLRISQFGQLVANWYVITPDAADGTIEAPELPESTLELLLPSLAGLQIEPAFGSLVAFDFQSYNDLITTVGFRPTKFMRGFFESPEDKWMLINALPSQMPIDAVSRAWRSAYWAVEANGPGPD